MKIHESRCAILSSNVDIRYTPLKTTVQTPRFTNVSIATLGEQDLPSVARVHAAAFPLSCLTSLGRPTLNRLYLWQMKEPDFVGALSIRVDSELVGYAFIGVGHNMANFIRTNMIPLAGAAFIRPFLWARPAFLRRLTHGATTLLKNPNGETSQVRIEHRDSCRLHVIAVVPKQQQAGVGGALLKATEQMAIEKGLFEMRLSVRSDNEGAFRFYDRHAWTRGADLGNGLIEMVKKLKPDQSTAHEAQSESS